MMVLEKRSVAIARGARIYAELAAAQMLNQAHHVTGLDGDTGTMEAHINRLVDKAAGLLGTSVHQRPWNWNRTKRPL